MKIIFILSLLLLETLSESQKQKAFNYNFQQSDYEVKHIRLEIVRYNKDYFNIANTHNFKYNRTCAATNITFELKVGLGHHFEASDTSSLSNEYRYFPLRFQVNVCKGLSANMFGINKALHCGNFTGCPLLKNTIYHICNWNPDAEKFPPMVPTGDYTIELQGLYGQQDIGLAEYYMSINRPIAIP